MRTRRSPKNQMILWRALGGVKRQPAVKRTRLCSREEARRVLFAASPRKPDGDR